MEAPVCGVVPGSTRPPRIRIPLRRSPGTYRAQWHAARVGHDTAADEHHDTILLQTYERAELSKDRVRRRCILEGEPPLDPVTEPPLGLMQQMQASGQRGRLPETHIRNLVEWLAYQAHQAAVIGAP